MQSWCLITADCAHTVSQPSGVGQRCWLWWLISSDQVFWRLLSFYLPADSNLMCLILAVWPLTSIKSHLFGMNPPCSGSFSVGPPELCELKLKCYVTAGVKAEEGVNDWLEVCCSSKGWLHWAQFSWWISARSDESLCSSAGTGCDVSRIRTSRDHLIRAELSQCG